MSLRGLVMFSRLGSVRSLVLPICHRRIHVHQIKNRFCVCPRHLWTKNNFNISSVCVRHFSSHSPVQQKSDEPTPVTTSSDDQSQASLGIFKRFKDAYKEHGKVLIGVHLVTSSIWFGTFYYAAASGLDITPLLAKLGASEKIIAYLSSTVGNVATAYVMYKIATPARYTVTVLGTYSSVKYLRKLGYMDPPPEGDTIRELMKDGQSHMKGKYVDMKGDLKEKYSEIKDDVKDKMKKRKDT